MSRRIKVTPGTRVVVNGKMYVQGPPSPDLGNPFWYDWYSAPFIMFTEPGIGSGIEIARNDTLKQTYVTPRSSLVRFKAVENYPPGSNNNGVVDARNCPLLQELEVQANALKEVKVSGSNNLKLIYANGNYLDSFDASNLSNLETLGLSQNSNYLTNVNITGCTKLSELNLSYNPLFVLTGLSDFSTTNGNKTIRMSYCYKTNPVIEGYFSQLPNKGSATGTWKIFVDNNFDLGTLNTSIAENKGWVVSTTGF